MAHYTATNKGIYYNINILFYILFQLFFFYSSWNLITNRTFSFSMPLAVAFLAEQVRMSMKIHSYYREKITWEIFNSKYSIEPQISKIKLLNLIYLPQFEYIVQEIYKYAYFMMAPTLIYRDYYPRSRKIRWGYVFYRLIEFCGTVYYAFLIFRQVLPQFSINIGEPISASTFFKMSFKCM